MEIEVGDKFFVPNDGTIFIVDKIETHEKWGVLVCSSLEGGAKGNYRDSLEDFIEFLKDMKATKIN